MSRRSFILELMETGQLSVDDSGHLIIFGEYIFLLPIGIVLKLIEILEKDGGIEKANEILEKIGEVQVEEAAKRYIKRFDFQKLDKRKIADFTTKIIDNLGWGNVIMKNFSFKDKTADVIVENSALSIKYKQVYQKNSARSIDYWIAGILKKHFSVIFETDMVIEEIKCLAKGDKYCEFIIRPKP